MKATMSERSRRNPRPPRVLMRIISLVLMGLEVPVVRLWVIGRDGTEV